MDTLSAAIYVTIFLLVNSNLNAANQMPDQLRLNLQTSGDNLKISWTLTSNVTNFSGFTALISDEEDTILYQSPLIHTSQRSMTLHQEIKGKIMVCVRALLNDTDTLAETCDTIQSQDLKMIVGILAGTIFLIPSIIGLMYIIYKDKRIMEQQDYARLQDEIDNKKKDIIGPSTIAIEIEKNVVSTKPFKELSHAQHKSKGKHCNSNKAEKVPIPGGATNFAYVADQETDVLTANTARQSMEKGKLSQHRHLDGSRYMMTKKTSANNDSEQFQTAANKALGKNKVPESDNKKDKHKSLPSSQTNQDQNLSRLDNRDDPRDIKSMSDHENKLEQDSGQILQKVTTTDVSNCCTSQNQASSTIVHNGDGDSSNRTSLDDNKSPPLSPGQQKLGHISSGDVTATADDLDNDKQTGLETSANFTSVRL